MKLVKTGHDFETNDFKGFISEDGTAITFLETNLRPGCYWTKYGLEQMIAQLRQLKEKMNP